MVDKDVQYQIRHQLGDEFDTALLKIVYNTLTNFNLVTIKGSKQSMTKV